MDQKVIKKVVWAVDAFEEHNSLQENVVKILKLLSNKCAPEIEVKIEPVYVLSPDQLNLPRDYGGQFITQYHPAAKLAFEQRLKQYHIPELQEPKILVFNQYSLRSHVQHFLDYANETQADLIVLGTHGRQGFSRIMLGSFTEALLVISKIPVLVVGQTIKPDTKLDRILFPCELDSEPEDSNLPEAISIAKQLKSKLTLLNAIPPLLEPVFQSGVYLLGGGWIPSFQFSEKEFEKRTQYAEKWTNWGNQAGIQMDYKIDTQNTSIVEAVVSKARSTAEIDLIVMKARSGPVAAALLGSITRQVVRLAPCPVWVLR